MEPREVVELLEMSHEHGVRVWVAGGWAVDALVGEQTRPHADLDLAVDAHHVDALVAALQEAGFNTAADMLPSRLEVAHPDTRRVDLHPVTFSADGSGAQANLEGLSPFHYGTDGFTTGTIDGHVVPCLSARQQLPFREGYDWRDVDHHDTSLLRDLITGAG